MKVIVKDEEASQMMGRPQYRDKNNPESGTLYEEHELETLQEDNYVHRVTGLEKPLVERVKMLLEADVFVRKEDNVRALFQNGLDAHVCYCTSEADAEIVLQLLYELKSRR